MNQNDYNQPVTKGDLHELDQRLSKKIDAVDQRLGTQIDTVELKLSKRIETMKDEILHHFDAVTENIQHDVAGANADEISLIKNKQVGHEQRITRLEEA